MPKEKGLFVSFIAIFKQIFLILIEKLNSYLRTLKDLGFHSCGEAWKARII